MLRRARQFFEERCILEVDTPSLTKAPPVDAHIDLLQTTCGQFLLSSPELPMKRLLAQGAPDIYQLSHVFRKEEQGPYHLTEFLMAEWYRKGVSLHALIEETCCFCELFLGKKNRIFVSYRQLFEEHLQVDPWTASREELEKIALMNNLEVPDALTKDDLLSLLLTTQIEPKFTPNCLTIISFYPPSQAALAKTQRIDDVEVAERFEIYFTTSLHKSVELANGYHEVNSSSEMIRRLQEANRERKILGKTSYPVEPTSFSLFDEIPDCCGVAVGVDRLFMLEQQESEIQSILPQ